MKQYLFLFFILLFNVKNYYCDDLKEEDIIIDKQKEIINKQEIFDKQEEIIENKPTSLLEKATNDEPNLPFKQEQESNSLKTKQSNNEEIIDKSEETIDNKPTSSLEKATNDEPNLPFKQEQESNSLKTKQSNNIFFFIYIAIGISIVSLIIYLIYKTSFFFNITKFFNQSNSDYNILLKDIDYESLNNDYNIVLLPQSNQDENNFKSVSSQKQNIDLDEQDLRELLEISKETAIQNLFQIEINNKQILNIRLPKMLEFLKTNNLIKVIHAMNNRVQLSCKIDNDYFMHKEINYNFTDRQINHQYSLKKNIYKDTNNIEFDLIKKTTQQSIFSIKKINETSTQQLEYQLRYDLLYIHEIDQRINLTIKFANNNIFSYDLQLKNFNIEYRLNNQTIKIENMKNEHKSIINISINKFMDPDENLIKNIINIFKFEE